MDAVAHHAVSAGLIRSEVILATSDRPDSLPVVGRAVLNARAMVRDLVENRDSTARDHLANERTFLAWIRTALGLVGLGVLLERLGAGNGQTIAMAAGVGFIAFGGLTLIYAVSRYLRVAKNLERGLFPVAIRGPILIAFGALLVAGGAMVYVLLLH